MLGVARRWFIGRDSGLMTCLTEWRRSCCRSSAELEFGFKFRSTAAIPENTHRTQLLYGQIDKIKHHRFGICVLTSNMCRCLWRSTLCGEAGGAIAGRADDVITGCEHIHAAAHVGACRPSAQGLVSKINGPYCYHLQQRTKWCQNRIYWQATAFLKNSIHCTSGSEAGEYRQASSL